MDNCLFCKIIEGKIPAKKVFEDDLIVVIEDIAPVAPLHLLLISKKHIVNTLDVTNEDAELLSRIFQVAARISKEKGLSDSGFRIVSNNNEGAGQSVFHLHFHLLAGRRFNWPPG
jgi:histidine triad (HIT) family protein